MMRMAQTDEIMKRLQTLAPEVSRRITDAVARMTKDLLDVFPHMIDVVRELIGACAEYRLACSAYAAEAEKIYRRTKSWRIRKKYAKILGLEYDVRRRSRRGRR